MPEAESDRNGSRPAGTGGASRFNARFGGRDERIALINDVEAAVEPLDAGLIAIGSAGYFDALAQRPNREIRLELIRRSGIYADEDKKLWFETVFYGNAIRWAVSRSISPFGLSGGDELVRRRVRMLLDGAKEQGRFPPLNSLLGQVNVLVLVGRLIPLGVWHADLYDFSYSTLLRMKPRDAARFAKHMIWSMNGPGPVLKFFLPPQPNYHVIAADYVATHRVAADLMRSNPRIRAIFQSNWYLDPEVAEISPHLAFLSRFATSHGSIIGKVGSDEEVVRESTWKSGNRKRLYESGRYVPTRYYRLWPRDAVLLWADSTHAQAATAQPAAPSVASQAVGSVSPVAPAAARKVVLVVDEDSRFQRLASEAVKAEGHQVSVAGDVAMALALVARIRQVDLLIATIALPNGGNGVRLAQEVRRRSPDASVILTSNYLDGGDAGHAAYKMAGARVLTKPRNKQEIVQLVRAAFGVAEEKSGATTQRTG